MRFTKNLRALLGCALLATASTVSAANLNFNVPDGSWFTPTNWTPGGPPTNLDNARIGTATTQSTAIARINTGGTANANNVVLGLDAGTDGTLRINNGSSLGVGNNFTVGNGGTGTFFSLDSTLTQVLGDMIVGNQSGAVGTANVRDDSTLEIGGFLRIGNQAGSTGTMDVNTQSNAILGAGVAAGAISGNIVVGNAGTGNLTIHDGAVVGSFNAIVIGNQATGVGTVTLRGENSTGMHPQFSRPWVETVLSATRDKAPLKFMTAPSSLYSVRPTVISALRARLAQSVPFWSKAWVLFQAIAP